MPETLLHRQDRLSARRAAVIEDVEWLLSCREHPVNIPARVGHTTISLIQACRRAGRPDLVRTFSRDHWLAYR